MAYAGTSVGGPIGNLELALYVVLAQVAVVGTGMLVDGGLAEHERRQRDEDAQGWLQRIVAGERDALALPFLLYLRPFSRDGAYVVASGAAGTASTLSPSRYSLDAVKTMERVLLEALGRTPLTGRMIGRAIGDSLPAIEPEDWKRVFPTLFSACRAALVLPGDSEGIRWELEFVRGADGLHKCIFLMPPTGSLQTSQVEEDWFRAATSLRPLNIFLPPYRREGSVFLLDGTGRPVESSWLPLDDPSAVARVLSRSTAIVRERDWIRAGGSL